MKIFSLASINFNNKQQAVKNDRQPNYTEVSISLSRFKTLQQDTVTFSAKIPSICTPTMEDLVNRTKATDILRYNVLRLAEHGITCPVCGHLLFPISKHDKFERNIITSATPKDLLDAIAEHKKYLHPVERKIFSMMREDSARDSGLPIIEMLKRRLPMSEKRIIFIQSKIFNRLEELSRNLPNEERIQVSDLINETYERILDPRETSRFSRYIFINKLKNVFVPEEFRKHFKGVLSNWIYTDLQDCIIEEAVRLPMAYNDIDAFIVKYAKRNYKGANPDNKISLRMLDNPLVSVEHIKAQKKRGETEPKNLALECAACNNRKRDESVIEQITENPQMIVNYPRYIKRLCELHHQGIVEKSYIRGQHETFQRESFGILSADLSSIEGPSKVKSKKVRTDKTPTKEERRAARKAKLKAKKQEKINNFINICKDMQ